MSNNIRIKDSKDLLEKMFLADFSTIQAQIGRYDNHSLIIKGWAITLWAGLIYFIVKDSVHELFIIQIIILLIFWSFDALFKFYQRRFALRYDELRKYFEGYNLDIVDGEIQFKYSGNKKVTNNKSDDNKISLSIINPREKFSDKKSELRKSLRRCILLRAVSVVYIYLISATFFLSVFIIEFSIPILICSSVILSFGVGTYICGVDKTIEDHKKVYLLSFYISIIFIIINLILLGFYIFNFSANLKC